MLYQSTRKGANALSLFTIINRTNTYNIMEIILEILLAVMLTVLGYQIYQLGITTGRLQRRTEELDELNAELKNLRGY